MKKITSIILVLALVAALWLPAQSVQAKDTLSATVVSNSGTTLTLAEDVIAAAEEQTFSPVGAEDGIFYNDEKQELSLTYQVGGTLTFTLGATPAKGDVLTVKGSFEGTDNVLALEKYEMVYTGSSWKQYTLEADSSYTVVLGEVKGTSGVSIRYTQPSTFSSTLLVFPVTGRGSVTYEGDSTIKEFQIDRFGYFQIVLNTGSTPVTGDIIRFGGEFSSSTGGARFMLPNYEVIYNGSKWIGYTIPEEGIFNVSFAGTYAGNSVNMYFNLNGVPEGDSVYFPYKEDGSGATRMYSAVPGRSTCAYYGNNEITSVRTIGKQFLVIISATPVKGDVLSVGGEFNATDSKSRLIFEKYEFIFNGSRWVEYTLEEEYCNEPRVVGFDDTPTPTELYLALEEKSSSAVDLEFSGTSEIVAVPERSSLIYEGDNTITTFQRALGGTLNIALEKEPAVGDRIVFSGEFAYPNGARRITFEETILAYVSDGETAQWKVIMSASIESSDGYTLTLKEDVIQADEAQNLIPVGEEDGIFVNGTKVDKTLTYNPDGTLLFSLDSVALRDSIEIKGTFQAADILVELESYELLGWKNNTVMAYPATHYDLTVTGIRQNSDAQHFYFFTTGQTTGYASQTRTYYPIQGKGVNAYFGSDTSAKYLQTQKTNAYLHVPMTNAQAGDIIAFDGQFLQDTGATTMSISEAVYFNGTNWQRLSALPANAGDTNYDSNVDLTDLVRLIKYNAEGVGHLFAGCADMTTDSVVDEADVIALADTLLETGVNL